MGYDLGTTVYWVVFNFQSILKVKYSKKDTENILKQIQSIYFLNGIAQHTKDILKLPVFRAWLFLLKKKSILDK